MYGYSIDTNSLTKIDSYNEREYCHTTYGLAVLQAGELRLYTTPSRYTVIYSPDYNAALIQMNGDFVGIYEPNEGRVTRVAVDGTSSNQVLFKNSVASPTQKPGSNNDFIFPNSSIRKLTEYEIERIGHERMLEARYEILARNGYVFNAAAYQNYFESKSWYTRDPNFAFDDMNEIERYNYELIKKLDTGSTPTPVPTAPPVNADFIFPYSSLRKLSRSEITSIDPDRLLEARYEILARNGYVFKSESYQRYFESKSWYYKDSRFKFADMNAIEAYNYALIKKIDTSRGATPVPTVTPTERPDDDEYDYIFPESSVRRLTERQVESIDPDRLLEARYEILARNGNVFNSNKWQRYFETKAWYSPDPDYEFDDMNKVESYNYALIRSIDENGSSDEDSNDFIFPDSSLKRLLASQVKALDTDYLLEARYEILARNGNVFNARKWQRYFESKSWYSADPDFEFGDMSAIESYNYELIREVDENS